MSIDVIALNAGPLGVFSGYVTTLGKYEPFGWDTSLIGYDFGVLPTGQITFIPDASFFLEDDHWYSGDAYQFTINEAAPAGSFVKFTHNVDPAIEFKIDVEIYTPTEDFISSNYDGSGFLSLNGLAAGTYVIWIYSYWTSDLTYDNFYTPYTIEFNFGADYEVIGSAPSPLSAQSSSLLAFHDFSDAILKNSELSEYYAMSVKDIEGNETFVPISSWQATIQEDTQNYIQCVIPAANQYLDLINDSVSFVIYKRAKFLNGEIFNSQIVEAPIDFNSLSYNQGPRRATITLVGYNDPTPAYPVTVTAKVKNVRSYTATGDLLRIRCSIDWLLKPGMIAEFNLSNGVTATLSVSYINYYVNENDAFMDIGER